MDEDVHAWIVDMRARLNIDAAFHCVLGPTDARLFYRAGNRQLPGLRKRAIEVYGETRAAAFTALIDAYVDNLEKRTVVSASKEVDGVDILPGWTLDRHVRNTGFLAATVCDKQGIPRGESQRRRMYTWLQILREDAVAFEVRVFADLYAWLLGRANIAAEVTADHLDAVVSQWTMPLFRVWVSTVNRREGPYLGLDVCPRAIALVTDTTDEGVISIKQ